MTSVTAYLSAVDPVIWANLAAILGLLMMSAFFSGSETALTAASRGKLHAQSERGERGAQTALRLTEDRERLIGAVLLGNNLVNILAAALATNLFTIIFGEAGVAVATLVMTALVLVFAEVLPKTYAITNPETAATSVARPIAVVVLVFAPVVALVQVLVRSMLRLVGVRAEPGENVLSVHEEIVGTLALGHSEGAVEKDDRDRILAALDLKNRTVDEIMLHRSGIEMIDADGAPEDILNQCLDSTHTRLPVYRGNAENIIGVVHAKELLKEVYRLLRDPGENLLEVFDPLSVAMTPYFVPDTTTLEDQMREFLRRRTHFALVVDEYGALQGLVTLEDILEEIVGEIQDEHDTDAESAAEPQPDGSFLVDGAVTIRDLNRALDWALPDDEANTIAGLVIHEAQSIPEPGQVFQLHGLRIDVMSREGNRITRLRLRKL